MGERIPYCGYCKDVFCFARNDGGRNQVENVSITPLETPVEECEIRAEVEKINSNAQLNSESRYEEDLANNEFKDMDQWEDGSMYGF